MSVVSCPPEWDSADEMEAGLAKAQAALAEASEEGVMQRDPYRLALVGLSSAIGYMAKTTRRWEQATGAVIAARQPFPQEERDDMARAIVEATEKGAFQGMRKEAQRMIRTLDRDLALRIGLSVGVAYVVGALSVLGVLFATHLGPFSRDEQASAAWRELARNNSDPRPALSASEVRADKATGRRYYAGVSLWAEPMSSAPAVTAKP